MGAGAGFCATDGIAHAIAKATVLSQATPLNLSDGIRGFKIGPVPGCILHEVSEPHELL
jgi:hypothetical protein